MCFLLLFFERVWKGLVVILYLFSRIYQWSHIVLDFSLLGHYFFFVFVLLDNLKVTFSGIQGFFYLIPSDVYAFYCILILLIAIFSSSISILFFFMISICLLNFSLCPCIIFPIVKLSFCTFLHNSSYYFKMYSSEITKCPCQLYYYELSSNL